MSNGNCLLLFLYIFTVMIRYYLLLLFPVFSVLIFSCGAKKNPDETDNSEKWVRLFNGKDLADWQIKISGFTPGENFGNTFRVQDSILMVRYDQYDSFNNMFGGIYYKKKFSNYRLKVEYRFVGETTPGAPVWGFRDSGVQYHCQDPSTLELTQSFPICLEYNLLGGNGKDERPTGEICANGIKIMVADKVNDTYCTPPVVKKTFHGDQWVTLEIDVQGDKIRHYVNGGEILAVENPRYDSANSMAKHFIVNGDNKVKEGYISLQSNSHPIDFRKIEIMEY